MSSFHPELESHDNGVYIPPITPPSISNRVNVGRFIYPDFFDLYVYPFLYQSWGGG